jgi:hypothetical protein
VGPISISVPIWGQTPQSKQGVQRQSSTSTSSSASCQSCQSHSLSSPESMWSQGSTSASSRSRVVYQSTSTPQAGQLALGGNHPPVVGEVLAPPVEAPTVTPDGLDDPPDPPVAAREQALDDAGPAVVVAEADGRAVAAVGADRLAQQRQPRVGLLGAELGGPLERRVRLGHEAADRDGAPDVRRPADLAPGLDDPLGELGDLQDVLVGLGRQPAHEVELHLPPAGGVRGGHRADEVLLGDHLVDDLADALGAALGGEGQPGASAVAGQLVGQVDVEGVDPGRRQRQARVGALVAVGQPLGHRRDLGVVGRAQREQPDLLEAGGGQAALDHLADAGDLRSRTGPGDHPAWQNRHPRVQPRKISTDIRSCTVSASGTSGCFG